jgi:2'-5' RNA ligase
MAAPLREGDMFYVMSYQPEFGPELSQAIAAIRRVHDPTEFLMPPHVTLLFPTASSIGEARLIEHLDGVLRETRPFEIRFGGFSKSRDHWLFLEVTGGGDQVRSLYRSIHSGILADGRNEEFLPHLGLGLFLKPGATYDYRNPRESDFDRERYEAVLRQAESLPLARAGFTVELLRLSAMPDSIAEWTTGRIAAIPRDARMRDVHEFRMA